MDTIAALATAPFKAAIGVIRMSGPEAFSIAARCLRIPGSRPLLSEGQQRNVCFAYLVDGEEVVDEVVVCAFRGPRSYTGEDTVEFSCHGGVYLLDRGLRLLFSHGARQAEGGEFTKRAFLNGKSDLTRAEGVMDLIDAEYSTAARAAMSELDGSVGKAIEELRDEITGMTAKLLAYVDYPDDEIGEVSREELEGMLNHTLNRTKTLRDSYQTGRMVKEGIRTVLCGRPNVGKSSLMNRISGTDRSIVTHIPGTTRDTVKETVVFGGLKLLLSDTAGIRETQDTVEQLGVQRAQREMEQAELIFCVFGDAITEDDLDLINQTRACSGRTVYLFNQSDRCRVPIPPALKGEPVFRVSAVTGEGLDAVEQELQKVFPSHVPTGSAMISNSRQFQCLCRVSAALERAYQNLNLTPDVIVSDLEEALAAVGEITGETVSQRVVQEIFSRFCVGK